MSNQPTPPYSGWKEDRFTWGCGYFLTHACPHDEINQGEGLATQRAGSIKNTGIFGRRAHNKPHAQRGSEPAGKVRKSEPGKKLKRMRGCKDLGMLSRRAWCFRRLSRPRGGKETRVALLGKEIVLRDKTIEYTGEVDPPLTHRREDETATLKQGVY